MRDDEEFNAEKAIRILNHPMRVRIIQLLGSKGPLSWKELSREMQTSTGSLYHHLDTLERLVTRDSSKRYALTTRGEDVYHYLSQNPSRRDVQSLTKLIEKRSLPAFVKGIFIPRSLVYFLTATRRNSIVSSIGFSVVVLVLMTLSRNQLTLLYFSPSHSVLQSAEGFAGSLLALTALTYVGMRVLGARPDPMVLLTSSSIALLPLAVFSLILRSLATLGYLGILADINVLTLAFVFFQAWAAGIVATGMSISSGLRIEKTLIASVALLYAAAIIMLIRGVRFI